MPDRSMDQTFCEDKGQEALLTWHFPFPARPGLSSWLERQMVAWLSICHGQFWMTNSSHTYSLSDHGDFAEWFWMSCIFFYRQN